MDEERIERAALNEAALTGRGNEFARNSGTVCTSEEELVLRGGY